MDSHLEIVESDPLAGRRERRESEGPKINHGNVHFSSLSTSTLLLPVFRAALQQALETSEPFTEALLENIRRW